MSKIEGTWDDKSCTLTTVYEFNYPPSVVFDGVSKVKYMIQWFCDESCKVGSYTENFSVGGFTSIVMVMNETKQEYPLKYEWKEINKPNKLVSFNTFDCADPSKRYPALATATFEPLDNGKRTLFKEICKYNSVDDLHAVKAICETGMDKAYQRLNKVLKDIKID